MKAIIQRVTSASVVVDGETISSIGKGLCILVGIHRTDTKKELDYIDRKITATKAEVFYYLRQLCKRQLFSQKFNC